MIIFLKKILNTYILACKPGYIGINCTRVCPYPLYGVDCQMLCNCSKNLCDARLDTLEDTVEQDVFILITGRVCVTM